jgi:uncharacterized protein YigE (DUF2233 family)
VLSAQAFLGSLPAPAADPPTSEWEQLEPGLEFASWAAPERAESGDSLVRVLRIDPHRFELRLLNSSASPDPMPLTGRAWAGRHGLVAAINASLYQTDLRTSVALMRTRDHVNNARLSRDNAVLAFDRLDGGVPPVQIIDRTCQDFDRLRGRYGTLVQGIRMMSCDGRNVWRQQPKKWSTAAIGVDRQGRVLFTHVRSPYSTHDLIDHLLALPLELKNAMYVEGGPQAQLYVRAGDREMEFVGSHGSRFGSESARVALPVPNVIGVVRVPGGPDGNR